MGRLNSPLGGLAPSSLAPLSSPLTKPDCINGRVAVVNVVWTAVKRERNTMIKYETSRLSERVSGRETIPYAHWTTAVLGRQQRNERWQQTAPNNDDSFRSPELTDSVTALTSQSIQNGSFWRPKSRSVLRNRNKVREKQPQRLYSEPPALRQQRNQERRQTKLTAVDCAIDHG